jgi:hypothetical protein
VNTGGVAWRPEKAVKGMGSFEGTNCEEEPEKKNGTAESQGDRTVWRVTP